MKQQAEQFPTVAQALEDLGCTIAVHGDGLLPAVYNTPFEALTEREKYHRMWAVPGYRDVAPGELAAATFLDLVKPDGLVVDFGCGTGRGGLAIEQAGHEVILVDFASNCRDPEAMALPFVELDLSEPCPLRVPYGYCTDVMEHIPPHQVETVVGNIMAAAGTVFFQIATVPDKFGAVIGQRLHLTVQPHAWWAGLFERLGFAITWQADNGMQSQFVITRV
jgi:SAM-dependent methyltransferase